jgi:acyl carrier protein
MKIDKKKIKEMVAEKFGVNPKKVTSTASFTEDLEADSLDTVELVMFIEDTFNITVPNEDFKVFKNVQSIVDYLEKHPANQK